jgi:general secretion pathway protein G
MRMKPQSLLTCRQLRGQSTSGFTLIELLVVFSLMALLLSIAVPRFVNTTDNAKEKVRQQNLATLRDSIDKFRADQDRYPIDLSELVQKHYLRSVPLDPVTGSATWITMPHPTAQETGIYDVSSPSP